MGIMSHALRLSAIPVQIEQLKKYIVTPVTPENKVLYIHLP